MRKTVTILLLLATVLSGCGYHSQLKNVQLIYATSLDLNDKNEIVANVTIQTPGEQEKAPRHEVIMAQGLTLQESLFKKIALQIAGPVGTSKNQIILMSDKLARNDLAVTLDSTFRNANDPMQSRMAIVPGDASKLIHLERIGSATVGEYLRKIIISAVYETDIPFVTLHSLYPTMFDPGRDTVLPMLDREGDKAQVKGIALMHDRRYTGQFLSQNESTLFLLLNGEKGGICVITRSLQEGENKNKDASQMISINIVKAKRTKRVTVSSDGRVRVNMNLKMKASVVEYAGGDLSDKQTAKNLNKKLSQMLTEEYQHITEKLKLANCDALGIGRDIMAFHPKEWKKLNWQEDYRNTDFRVSATVDIISHGVKN